MTFIFAAGAPDIRSGRSLDRESVIREEYNASKEFKRLKAALNESTVSSVWPALVNEMEILGLDGHPPFDV